MEDTEQNLPDVVEEQVQQPVGLPADQPIRVPLYRRVLKPSNLVLSADDLKEFCELLVEVNEKAKEIEYSRLDLTTFKSPEQATARVNDLVCIEYNYVAGNGDAMQGLGIPKTDERAFPDDLQSLFASNAAYAERAINLRPLNTVEVLLGFEKPSLKIDLQTLPSNPTENRSIINVAGRDEDWVISTAQKIDGFFKKRKAARPIIHGSGAYDYIVYLAFLPAVIWLFYKYASPITLWLEQQTIFLNVILGIYGLLLSLLFARFLFQYARWLFPPMEYYKRSRLGAFIHRSIATVVATGVGVSAAYDLVKAVFVSLLP
ncbi:hypothetical protein [Frigidibacter sp. ROC022]|uniref:hypothetical protein n=1 Tax=Frigidibacter sp. ROC022 TaxID=2971796 RepID=UPI00215A95FF|nr:hypothetical protein [Frigidibacter sp. ROC022]MCR8723078.1 hypothetical protein [Frigidibacter sp. ROC022]